MRESCDQCDNLPAVALRGFTGDKSQNCGHIQGWDEEE